MTTLVYQIRDDLRALFADSSAMKKIYSEYNDEYADILIKEIYEIYPDIRYPSITIEEIENVEAEEHNEYDRENSEFATDLGYRIAISCEQTDDKSANENVRIIANIIDTYFKGNRYKALRRIGNIPIIANESDTNIKTGYITYNCRVDNVNHTIYRRK